MRLADPWLLAALAVLVPMLVWYRRRRAAVRFPSVAVLRTVRPSKLTALRHLPFALRALAVAALVVALARPQEGNARAQKTSEGLDVVMILDTSRSMEARDFVINGERPSRLAVVKRVISDFVKDRPSDRIGLVVFGSEAFTQAPLTLDHDVLQRFLERVQIGMAGDATAIGDALATAVNRLKDIEAKARVAILLTDGGNTAGRIDPLAATQAAKAKGVRVYTIGVGSNGEVPVVVNGRVQTQKVDIDEELLKQIAKETDGAYFRAADTETLVKVYETIDRLEKTRVKVQSFESYEERYPTYAGLAAALVMGELLVGLSRLRRVP